MHFRLKASGGQIRYRVGNMYVYNLTRLGLAGLSPKMFAILVLAPLRAIPAGLKKDQRVSFDIVTDDRRNKPRADRVRVLT
jgi:hypothetical protein